MEKEVAAAVASEVVVAKGAASEVCVSAAAAEVCKVCCVVAVAGAGADVAEGADVDTAAAAVVPVSAKGADAVGAAPDGFAVAVCPVAGEDVAGDICRPKSPRNMVLRVVKKELTESKNGATSEGSNINFGADRRWVRSRHTRRGKLPSCCRSTAEFVFAIRIRTRFLELGSRPSGSS